MCKGSTAGRSGIGHSLAPEAERRRSWVDGFERSAVRTGAALRVTLVSHVGTCGIGVACDRRAVGVNRTRADHNHERRVRLLNTIVEPQRIAGAPLARSFPSHPWETGLDCWVRWPQNDAPEHATTSAGTPSRPTICAMLRCRQTATESVISHRAACLPISPSVSATRIQMGLRLVRRSGRSGAPPLHD